MDISINAKVFCTDGECGHVTCVLINPVNRKITHLIVKEHGLLGQERMVPIDLITDSLPERINLQMNETRFHALENFISFKYVNGDDPFGVYPPEHYFFHPFVVPDYDSEDEFDTYYTPVENVPENELEISHGSDVYATDGHIGKVDEFLVSPINEKITHVVLREGHLWKQKHITIPVSDIKRIEFDGVYLKLTKDEVNKLPVIPIRAL